MHKFVKFVEYSNKKNKRGKRCLYICEHCGSEFIGLSEIIKNRESCGCIARKRLIERNKKMAKHGKSDSPIYNIWINMKRRCENKKDISFKNYGERGIIVCEKWQDFETFYNDIIDIYVKGYELDRKDNSKGYYKENIRFVPKKVNANNKRNNRKIFYKGIEKTVSEWADHFKIPYYTLFKRTQRHKDIKKIFYGLI